MKQLQSIQTAWFVISVQNHIAVCPMLLNVIELSDCSLVGLRFSAVVAGPLQKSQVCMMLYLPHGFLVCIQGMAVFQYTFYNLHASCTMQKV